MNSRTPREPKEESHLARIGLPGAHAYVEQVLRESGVDPKRLSVIQFGRVTHLAPVPPWLRRLMVVAAVWLMIELIRHHVAPLPRYLQMAVSLGIGLLILQASCEALVSAAERLAARFKWDHYVAGTFAEILSTTPELVVIAFVVPVSPTMAFFITLITIYNNALVFSLYSFFLPKDRHGEFMMPRPITEAGSQILVGGGAMGLILGMVMLTFTASAGPKESFSPIDLIFTSGVLLTIFCVYVYKLLRSYAEEETEVREVLAMSDGDIEQRKALVYENVRPSSLPVIAGLFLAGIGGAFIGGEQVSEFASMMVGEMAVNAIVTALILAVFAGMSEYVILFQSHRKGEYGIALANAFGGITQVMFLVLPFTLICIAVYELFTGSTHPELPLEFSRTGIFLLTFLFPTFYTLSSLLEENHTLGILDTVIMFGIFLFLIVLLVTHGNPG